MSERVAVVDLAGGRRTDLPDGSFVCELVSGPLNGAKDTALGYSVWKPGTASKQLVHETDELAYIVSGEGKMSVGDRLIPFTAGQALLIPAGVPHGLVNDSGADMSMVYVFSHREYPPTHEATGQELGRTGTEDDL
jgi:mannose-6-phosphate isomerase-like protein (cupin superfamily)